MLNSLCHTDAHVTVDIDICISIDIDVVIFSIIDLRNSYFLRAVSIHILLISKAVRAHVRARRILSKNIEE